MAITHALKAGKINIPGTGELPNPEHLSFAFRIIHLP
jgi:hypothetical protein